MRTNFARIQLALSVTLFFSIGNKACAGTPYLSDLHATKNSPLYTTYAAASQRSEFTLDVGYHLVFYDSSRGVEFQNQKGGNWSLAIAEMSNNDTTRFAWKISDFYRQPVITESYSDFVEYYYYPFNDLRIDVTFLVYSSRVAVQRIVLKNISGRKLSLRVAPFLTASAGCFQSIGTSEDRHGAIFKYVDLPDDWMIAHDIPHIDTVANVFMTSIHPDSIGFSLDSTFEKGTPAPSDSARKITLFNDIVLQPHGSVAFRVVRAVAKVSSNYSRTLALARRALSLDLAAFARFDEKEYSRIPRVHFGNADEEMMYWGAFSLLRQCMLPPEGKCNFNYYVFSREPVWGWGHGGQVFHESLSMLAYVFMDPVSAMNSQRVFMERQHPDGYIDYRVGPYLDETIPYNGQLTTSAPWFSWENWEIYRRSRDRTFLREAYNSGIKLFKYWEVNRDSQRDGLFEWGGHAVLESVRDDQVAVWDQVGWPANFEGPDLNSMLVMEAKSLSKMARALGDREQAGIWDDKAGAIAALINKYMWDDSTDFYYNVNKTDHSFTYKKPDDLKRKEIIGFLPMWAGVATKKQAAKLVKVMTDTAEFWRKYGIPSLAADDPYYNPKGYWNGPVWVGWEYLLERGLLKYGYRALAGKLVAKVTSNVISQLKKDHCFWEFYDPDARWAGYHRTYIWAGLVTRMLIDLKTQDR